MPEMTTPEDLSQTKQAKGMKEIAGKLLHQINQADANRSEQKKNLERWYKKRMGLRPPKNFPWPGCANIHLPLVDKSIKKLVPLYTGLVDTSGKVAVFKPAPNNLQLIKSVGKAEKLFTHLTQAIMNAHPTLLGISESFALGVDKMLEKGYCVMKVVWSTQWRRRSEIIDVEDMLQGRPREQVQDQEIAKALFSNLPLDEDEPSDVEIVSKAIKDFRSGKETIEVRYNEKVYDAPVMVVRDPMDITTPADTTNLQNARWIDDKFKATANDLLLDARSGKYNEKNVKAFLEDRASKKEKSSDARHVTDTTSPTPEESIQSLKHEREGITFTAPDLDGEVFTIHETGFYHDIDNDGIEEKCIITFPHDRPDLYFRVIELPYDHGQWPWIDFPHELADERYTSSRGIPEMLDHIQTILTSQHNFKLDSMTITNAPVITAVTGALNQGNITFAPGSVIKTMREKAVDTLQWQKNDLSFEREEQTLKAWAEEYMGLIDHTLSSPLNPTQEARTKFEIQTATNEKNRIFGQNAKVFLRRLRRVYEQIWSLWLQFGDRELSLIVNGEPLDITRDDFVGRFYVFPATTPEAVSAQGGLNGAVQDLQLFAGDPMTNQIELRQRYWRERDPMSVELMVQEPQELQQNHVERQVLEILEMKEGFDVAIKPDDVHEVHLQVVQQWLQQNAQGADEALLRRVAAHGKFHEAGMAQQQGQAGQAEKSRTEANQIMGAPE